MKSQNKQSVWTCMSEKAFSADVHWMTIFTPAYPVSYTHLRAHETVY